MVEFSILGGPLHRAGARLGLVRSGGNTVPIGIAIGATLWVVSVALATASGTVGEFFSLSKIAGHVRLLVIIPLYFVAEVFVCPRITAFVRTIVQSGVVPETEVPALESEIRRVSRWIDSWVPEAACAAAAVLVTVTGSQLGLSGSTAAIDPRNIGDMTIAAWWYWAVCLTFFRFLLLRWLWRLGVWTFFLWRVSSLQLRLIPTHPDGVAGLGYLAVVHAHLLPLVVAISALQSASLAEELALGTATVDAILPTVALLLVVCLAVFVGPLLVFVRKLWACRVKALSGYMEFSSSYVRGFETKWVGPAAAPGEPVLGTPDLQSLADLNNSMTVVRTMRLIPIGGRFLAAMSVAAGAPFLPLLLFQYPMADLVSRFLTRLTGF